MLSATLSSTIDMSFFSSLKDKAQSAVNSAGFGRSDNAESSEAGQTSSGTGLGGFMKSHGLEGIHHQLRTLQQQYSCVYLLSLMIS